MAYKCHDCGTVIHLAPGTPPARRDVCEKCNADLHCCRNCKFYAESAYNYCREPQAERVLDKANSNFCDYFVFTEAQRELNSSSKNSKENSLKKLDNLFK